MASFDRHERRTGVLVTPKAGIDLLGRWNHGLAGVGLFVGLPIGGVVDADGLGVMVGVRAPLGFF